MAYYVMLTKLTSEGRKTLMNNPGRLWEVNQEVEEMGAEILVQYALLGDFDFISILEASNSEVIARVASNLGSRGTLIPTTYSAIPIEQLIEELKSARS